MIPVMKTDHLSYLQWTVEKFPGSIKNGKFPLTSQVSLRSIEGGAYLGYGIDGNRLIPSKVPMAFGVFFFGQANISQGPVA